MTNTTQAPPEGQSDLRASVEAGRKRRRTGVIVGAVIAVAAIVAAVVFAVIAFSPKPVDDASAAAAPIQLTIAGAGESALNDAVKLVAAEKGLEVEWVNFTDDWTLPNTSLVSGEVDANAFQHGAFLSAFNVENDADLVPVVSTVIVQWGIFSSTLTDLADLADGSRVVIPDDASNGGRALGILQAAGLIEVDPEAGIFPTVDDITSNPKNLEFVEIKALTIPQQLDDPTISAVVVGTSYFDPSQGITADDALYLDDALSDHSLPYVNFVATRADNADSPAWEILKEVYADPRVAAALDEDSHGASVIVDIDPQRLQDKVAELEDFARAHS
ncbi:MetQ/NlpA family ABC transporter substrate-binding protein [Microbacterium sp. BWT-B31]|uniref:MetQ/NlpA family ABC transporter substrate-binding protein n=1 Tax=Microbacterium sp. BWT-B31 TaxID=3232072 RepID=UPI0035296BFD